MSTRQDEENRHVRLPAVAPQPKKPFREENQSTWPRQSGLNLTIRIRKKMIKRLSWVLLCLRL